ncbi:ABC transporter ATP-binding protein [Flavisolibacter nicotianae]|uniref:ABC transporter ATP-binding protein n=1 Tax=Flavisolibacter nicotianae TaxID=2364882 RepID=UPI000EB46900|nr:ABC transporter ATP-binding protein [Flavisolibacter nicotianae]
MDLLHVSRLRKSNKETLVLNDVSFSYQSFKRLAVAGETGSGKTTLLKAIAGLVQPDSGNIFFEGQRVAGPDEKLLPGHKHIAYLSQHFELRNNYKLDDYLEMASLVGEEERHRIYALCQVDHLLTRRTDQLSGGERQRTALARLLTTLPRLLLLDEPFSNLDGIHKQILKTVLDDIVREGKTACIMVSHDPMDVLPWAEEVLVLKGGTIIQKAAPEKLYRQPVNEYIGGLFGDYNLLTAEEAKTIFSIVPAEGERLFIRPENIRLEKTDGGAGLVSAAHFFGSYYELDVVYGATRLWIKTNSTGFQKGDRVKAAVNRENCWYL